MKGVRDYFKVIAFVLAIAVAIPLGGSFFQNFLATLRYATMNEKDASKDVIIYEDNDFSKFDISEYDELGEIIKTVLYPCYLELDDALEQINLSINDQNILEKDLYVFYSVLEKWQTSILTESINRNGQVKSLLNDINNDFIDIENVINRILTHHTDSVMQVANQSLLVSRIKDFYYNYCYSLLYLINGIKNNINLTILFNHVVDSINNLDNDPLIDLETPYFSLPNEYAENKEKQIFLYIEKGRRDSRSVMALILLYIKMKNITDAELLYSRIIAPLHSMNSQDNELSRTIALMLNELRNNNPNAILDKTTIEVDTNMNVQIIEHYFVHRPENNKEVYIFLPYDLNDITLVSLVDNNQKRLQIKNAASSWKNSCYLQFACDEELVEFNIKYRVDNFFVYSKNYGTYSYRYGGINQNSNYTCEVIMPSFLKATTFHEYPTAIKNDEANYEQNILWTNPAIPFKISALDFSDYKNGIAGEVIPWRLLYNKWIYLVFILFLFILFFAIISNVVSNILVYEYLFLLISTATLFLLFGDIRFVEIIQVITKSFPNVLLRIVLGVLIIASSCLLYVIKYDKGNRYFRIVSSVILLSIGAYAVNLFLQNSDQTNIMSKILFALYIVWYLFILVKHLSRQMDVSETVVLIMAISIIVISFSLSNAFKVAYISKPTLNLLGLIIGIVFTFVIVLCLVIENKKIRNVNNQTKFELFIDSLNFNFQGKVLPIANMLIMSFIAISLISEYAFLPLIFQLGIAIFSPKILEAINSGNIFGKNKNKNEKG